MAMGGETKKRASIVASLTLWYIALTIVNIGVFWVGAGSNQMRLISEKATISARSVAYEVLRRIQPFVDVASLKKNPAADFKISAPNFHQLITKGKPAQILSNYRILSAGAELLYTWPDRADKKSEASAKEILDSLKALQLKEVKNELFIGVPDLSRREIDLFIPITAGGANDLILISKLPLTDIQSEISGLIRLGIGMVVLLLALQTGMGFLIYKNFVVPIQNVGAAALRVATGNFDQIDNPRRKDDEINQLIDSFNTMSSQLKKNRDRMQLELDIARKIQASILPQTLQAGHLIAHIYYNPLAVVSGDYYDFIELSDGSMAIFIGDASGHGVPAAFITVMAKVYFTSLVEKISEPAKLLSAMNERMSSYFSGAGLYLTAFYLRVYPSGRAVYCNALHPDPIILRANGETELLKPTGFYVGLLKKVFKEYTDAEIQLNEGDRIVLYTDGFTEAMNTESEVFSPERFIETTEAHRHDTAADSIQNTIKIVSAYQGEAEKQDDETLIVIEIGERRQIEAPTIPTPAIAAPLPEMPKILPDLPPPIEIEPQIIYDFESTKEYTSVFEKIYVKATSEAAMMKILRNSHKALKDREFWKGVAGFGALNRKKPGDAATLFHIALGLYGLKLYADCNAVLDASLASDDRLADAYWLRALTAIKTGNDKAALKSIKIAIAENPDEPRYRKVEKTLAGKKA